MRVMDCHPVIDVRFSGSVASSAFGRERRLAIVARRPTLEKTQGFASVKGCIGILACEEYTACKMSKMRI